MADVARKTATYDDLCSLPDNMVGEILDGELIATPRPAGGHVLVASVLGMNLGPPFQFGQGGGPGGWWILDEPEIHLGEHVLVPDLAGWRKETMPSLPKDQKFLIPPNWLCEVISPSTVRTDRIKKMRIYAEFGVPFLWLIDPDGRTLEVFSLESGRWTRVSAHAEDEKVRAVPFHDIEIELRNLWGE